MSRQRQQTQAKAARERAVRERRELKEAKRRAAAAERKDRAAGILPPAQEEEAVLDPLLDAHEADGDDGAIGGRGVVSGLEE